MGPFSHAKERIIVMEKQELTSVPYTKDKNKVMESQEMVPFPYAKDIII